MVLSVPVLVVVNCIAPPVVTVNVAPKDVDPFSTKSSDTSADVPFAAMVSVPVLKLLPIAILYCNSKAFSLVISKLIPVLVADPVLFASVTVSCAVV